MSTCKGATWLGASNEGRLHVTEDQQISETGEGGVMNSNRLG